MKLSEAFVKFREDAQFKEDFLTAAKEDRLEDFIVLSGLECTKDELIVYVKDSIERANWGDPNVTLCSIGTFGISCAISAATKGDAGCGLV